MATSIYLDNLKTMIRVQPSGKILATAIADFLISLGAGKNCIIVSKASLHTDAFIAALKLNKIKPHKVSTLY